MNSDHVGPASSLRRVELRDGSEVWVRPIERTDQQLLADGYRGLSDTSRRRRFLAPAAELSPEDLAYLTDIDHRRHDALVALDAQGHAVGVARYVRLPGEPEAAEVAVVVADQWQRRGVATELLNELTERARRNGLRRYMALVSDDNAIVIDVLERIGAARFGVTDTGEIEFGIDFPAEGIGQRLRSALRAAATGQLDLVAGLARRLAVWRRG